LSQVIERAELGGGLEAARGALSGRAWNEAFELFKQAAGTTPLSPDDLEGLAEAAWWTGRLDENLAAREQAFTFFLEENNTRRAALCAIALGRDYYGKLAYSIAAGWLKRAERLLENDKDSAEYGHLLVVKALGGLESHEPDASVHVGEKILELGTRFADRDLQGFGLLFQGRKKVADGLVDEGLALLDEATVAAVSGELGPLATGVIYCVAITSTTNLRDYRRAGEWTEAAKRWCERQSISGFPGICRVHRAQILHLRGMWTEAEKDVRLAITELKDFSLDIAAEGFYELGEIRLRLGDLRSAEEAFRQAQELDHDPEPGMALLKLAEGDIGAASALIKRALADDSHEPLNRFALLNPQVEIALAAGDIETAAEATAHIHQIAETYKTPALKAAALQAAGAVELSRGEALEAVKSLRHSARLWKQADVPYEAARSCVLLARAYREQGDEDSATLEFERAASTFRKLGAALDLQAVNKLMGGKGTTGDHNASRVVKSFMFTDIVRSTKLVEALGDEAWGNLLDWHTRTLRSLFLAHSGEEVKQVGDGFFITFEGPADALACAVAIQRSLAEHRKTHGFSPQLRIGLHCGDATKKGRDYEGKEVHTAARIGAIAGPDEVVASSGLFHAAESGLQAAETKTVSLNGIADPVEVVTVAWRQ